MSLDGPATAFSEWPPLRVFNVVIDEAIAEAPNDVPALEQLPGFHAHPYIRMLRFFSPDEIEQLSKAAASPQDRAIYRTAAFTGLRMGELTARRSRRAARTLCSR